jgi:hypothetical protein
MAQPGLVRIYMEPITPETLKQNIWQEKLAGVYIDDVTGIKLKCAKESSDILMKAFSALSIGLMTGAASPTETFSVWDANEQEHAISASEAVALLSRYTRYWFALWSEFAP